MVGSTQEAAADDDGTVSADDDDVELDQEVMLVPLDDAMVLLVLAVSESSSGPKPEGFDGLICEMRLRLRTGEITSSV